MDRFSRGGVCIVVFKCKFELIPLCITLGAFLPGCSARKQPSGAETALANMAKDVVIPIQAGEKENPLPDTDEVLKEGQQVFVQSCALCHGADGHGETDIGQNMYPPAMDMTSPHVQHWSDAQLFWIVQNGIPLTGMPAWESCLSAADVWKLARFIHKLPQLDAASTLAATAPQTQPPSQAAEPNLVKYGKTLYRQEGCFMCHRLNGVGGKVGPDLTTEGKRGRSDEWLIGHFKDPTAYVHGSVMPPFKNLKDGELKALTAFLQSQKGRGR